MKLHLMLLLTLSLTSCADMQATRQAQNKIQLQIDKSYQYTYRRILESTINECNYVQDAIKSAVYLDNNTANITNTEHGVVGWTMDIKKLTESTTQIDFYTAYTAQNKFAYRAEKAINNDLPGCIFNDPLKY